MKNLLVLMAMFFATSQVIAAQADFAQTSVNKDKKKDEKKAPTDKNVLNDSY